MLMNKKFASFIAILLVFALLAGCAGNTEPEIEEPAETPEENLVDNGEMPVFNVTRGTFRYAGMYDKEKDATAEYAYSDEYFGLDSSLYNPSLATMSLCLELSTWSSHETENWAEKSKNAKALLEEIGFGNFEQNEFWNEKPSTKSVGAVAAHKKLEDSTVVALSVRGGEYYNEWGSNVHVGLSGDHAGFAEGRDNVIRFLEEYIVEHEITGRVKLWLVGYSRGGAIANLTAGYLNQNELPNGAKLAFEDLYCYAFAPPKGAMKSEIGEDSEHANIHNIVNANDLVPLVAPGNWEFTRYNTTSRLLPTVTTAGFEEALATMLEEYDEVLLGTTVEDPAAAEYGISEYAKKIEITVNTLEELSPGESLMKIEVVDDTRQTMSEMLGDFITAFAEHVHGRDEYYNLLETDLISLLNDLMGYESDMDIQEVIDSFTDTLIAAPYQELKYVIEPAFSFGGVSKEEKINTIVDHLYEVVPQPEGYEDLYGTMASFIQIIGETIAEDSEKILDMILAFSETKLMQAHYPEIMLAWMRAGDVHYTENPFLMKVPESLRVVRINCPVNVEIYDSEGNLVARAVDGVCTTLNGVVGCAVNADGEIIIHLPSDAEYKVVTTATGDGEVNITLSEYNMARSATTRVQKYPSVPVKVGDVLTLDAPVIEEKEYSDNKEQGSTAEYQLTGNDGENIVPESESRGDKVEFHSVNIGGTDGTVIGGGSYLDGSFAQVEAQSVSGSVFEGWYINGEKVSDELVYRFAVDEDIDIEARFEKIPQKAETEEKNEAKEETELCSGCGKEVKKGESHVSACGVAGHYSCDGDTHGILCKYENIFDPELPDDSGSSGSSGSTSSDGSSDSTSSEGTGALPEMICGSCGNPLSECTCEEEIPEEVPEDALCANCGLPLDSCTCAGEETESGFTCKVCGGWVPEGEKCSTCNP